MDGGAQEVTGDDRAVVGEALLGVDDAGEVDPGLGVGDVGLLGALRDDAHGGWFTGVDEAGVEREPPKSAYTHAFVLLAGATAASAGVSGGRELLDRAAAVVLERFWDDEAGLAHEDWDRAWEVPEPYRGANSNMHLVEAFLAVFDATGERVWLERALRMARFFVHEVAAARDWRLPEHFDADWRVLADYNTDDRAHPFRPYGVTVGHVLEWARLLVHLEAALPEAPAWLLADAEAMFAAAVERGWSVDGSAGFVYTLDYDDTPVVRARMHWVVAEAVSAAAVLGRRTGDDRYERWYRTWWDHAAAYFVDAVRGSWHHELDPALTPPAGGTWSGKPDVYHAYQATRLPLLPVAPSLAGALAARG